MSIKPTDYDKLLKELESLPPEKHKEFFLEHLAVLQPKMMLRDLYNDALRTPALYNAITALLKYHKMEFDPVAAARPNHPLGALKHGLPPSDYDEGTAGFQH